MDYFIIKQKPQDSSGAFKVQDKALGEHLPWATSPGSIPLSELKPVKKLRLLKISQVKSPTANSFSCGERNQYLRDRTSVCLSLS